MRCQKDIRLKIMLKGKSGVQPNWKKIAPYKKSLIAKIERKSIIPMCILCETEHNITGKALWVNDAEKKVVLYFLCAECSEEFQSLSEEERESIVENVIEKKINLILALSHVRISELEKMGFKFEF